LIQELETRNRTHPRHIAARYAELTHYVVPLKESIVEVVARTIEVIRGREMLRDRGSHSGR